MTSSSDLEDGKTFFECEEEGLDELALLRHEIEQEYLDISNIEQCPSGPSRNDSTGFPPQAVDGEDEAYISNGIGTGDAESEEAVSSLRRRLMEAQLTDSAADTQSANNIDDYVEEDMSNLIAEMDTRISQLRHRDQPEVDCSKLNSQTDDILAARKAEVDATLAEIGEIRFHKYSPESLRELEELEKRLSEMRKHRDEDESDYIPSNIEEKESARLEELEYLRIRNDVRDNLDDHQKLQEMLRSELAMDAELNALEAALKASERDLDDILKDSKS